MDMKGNGQRKIFPVNIVNYFFKNVSFELICIVLDTQISPYGSF